MIPKAVKIVEVGPRDGLQNESAIIEASDKIALIKQLIDAGVSHIETSSFVSPKWVPQMATSADVAKAFADNDSNITLSALTPNLKGLEKAIASGVKEVAVFTAASEAFTQKNINCSISESIERFTDVLVLAQQHNIKVRGYVSCVMGCPYQGDVAQQDVLNVSQTLLDMGCYEVSLGDTIGVGTAIQTQSLVQTLLASIPNNKLAVHFHDTYGQALTNIFVALQHGISTVDSSVAGLGGCPYAKGASGNVATEDVLYMLHGMGIETGIDLSKVSKAGEQICQLLGKANQSKVANAILGA